MEVERNRSVVEKLAKRFRLARTHPVFVVVSLPGVIHGQRILGNMSTPGANIAREGLNQLTARPVCGCLRTYLRRLSDRVNISARNSSLL